MLISNRKILHFITGSIYFLFSSAAFSAHSQTVTFAEAVRYALTQNPRIAASNANVDAANAAITESRGKGLPNLNLEMNAAHSNNPLNVFSYKLAQGNASFADFGAQQYTGPAAGNIKPGALNSPSYYNNFNTGVAVKIPLFMGGSNLAAIARSHHLLSEALHGDQAARNELTYDVLQAYEGSRTTRQLVRIAEQSLHAASRYLGATKSLYQQSIALQSDVLLAETNLRSAEMTLAAAKAEFLNQLDAFHLLIGQPNSHLMPGEAVSLPLPREAMSDLEKRAIINNPHQQSLHSRVEAARAQISEANGGNWPQIDLQVRHDWNSNNLALNGSSNTALLEFNWQLFSSGAQYGAGKHAEAEYRRAYAELDNNSNNLQLAIAQALRAAHTAELQYKSNSLNANDAHKAVEILVVRYGRGAAQLSQLLDAQSRFDSAKAQQIMSRYNVILARARLLTLLNDLNIENSNTRKHLAIIS